MVIGILSSALRTLLVVTALLFPGFAWAHAHLRTASPPADSVGSSPSEIVLGFSEDIEPSFSEIRLFDPSGKPIETGKARLVEGSHANFSLPIKGVLPPGLYRVEWAVTSVDAHRTSGKFIFTVKASS